jgi:hypothetical protein
LRHGWDETARYDEELYGRVSAHPDAAEGIVAILAKRTPNFEDI